MPFFCPIAVSTPLEPTDYPLGSGPYYVASGVPNRRVVLKRNRFYRGPRPAHVDRVVFTVADGEAACQRAIENDRLDYCLGSDPSGTPTSFREDLVARYGLNRPGGRVFVNPVLATDYFAFNHDRPAFKGAGQIPLKQAINWVLDRHALAAAAGYLNGRRTDQILPPAIGRNVSIYPLRPATGQQLVKARALLAKARFKPTTLVLYAANWGTEPAEAQIFKYNLKRLGINVEIRYLVSLETGVPQDANYDVILTGWWADYADPNAFFTALDGTNMMKAGNSNLAHFDRLKYNCEIHRIERLTGEARRKASADLDIEMMRDDPPWAPFLNDTRFDFVSESLGCYVFQPVEGFMDIAAACKKSGL